MTPFYLWQKPSQPLSLTGNEIHVWGASLNVTSEALVRFSATLSSDEQTRAAQFRFSHDRNRFIAARGYLRAILSQYLDCSPDTLSFTYGKLGKPSLMRPDRQATLQFNLSHSHDVAVYAITQEREIGIDIEHIRLERTELLKLATRFFSHYESEALKALPEDEQQSAFYAIWTRKEAAIKAVGCGLYGGLSHFDVPVSPTLSHKNQITLSINSQTYTLSDVMLSGFEYRAALVMEGQRSSIAYFQYQESDPGPFLDKKTSA